METVFLVCAAVGGTVFVCQFVFALIGFGADDIDIADQVPDVGGLGDLGHVGVDGGHGIADGAVHAGATGAVGDHHAALHHGSTWLFGVVSFRTMVAALTFFGLAGFAAVQGGQGVVVSLAVAVVSGIVAMYVVHWIMQFMYGLGQDRTLRIAMAVGQRGTVYVPIPGANAGEGKIQVAVQERVVEYAAVTGEREELPTGAQIVITRIVSPGTVEVALPPS